MVMSWSDFAMRSGWEMRKEAKGGGLRTQWWKSLLCSGPWQRKTEGWVRGFPQPSDVHYLVYLCPSQRSWVDWVLYCILYIGRACFNRGGIVQSHIPVRIMAGKIFPIPGLCAGKGRPYKTSPFFNANITPKSPVASKGRQPMTPCTRMSHSPSTLWATVGNSRLCPRWRQR